MPQTRRMLVLASEKEHQIKAPCGREYGSFRELKDPQYCCSLKSFKGGLKKYVYTHTHAGEVKWKAMALQTKVQVFSLCPGALGFSMESGLEEARLAAGEEELVAGTVVVAVGIESH